MILEQMFSVCAQVVGQYYSSLCTKCFEMNQNNSDVSMPQEVSSWNVAK